VRVYLHVNFQARVVGIPSSFSLPLELVVLGSAERSLGSRSSTLACISRRLNCGSKFVSLLPVRFLPEDNKNIRINSIIFIICTGGRNRTHARGFGDPCTTIILHPQFLFCYVGTAPLLARGGVGDPCTTTCLRRQVILHPHTRQLTFDF
jgi:hypothetical protein